jgi:hypothetical protein
MIVENELFWQSCNGIVMNCIELHHIYGELQLLQFMQLSDITYSVKIRWVGSGHCNSKLSWKAKCKTPFFHSEKENTYNLFVTI